MSRIRFALRFAAQPEFQARYSRWGEYALIALSLAAIPIFIFVGVDRPVWLDEANSIRIAAQPFSAIVENLRHDNNFPLYYLLLFFWIRLFGLSEVALRALSAILYFSGGWVAFALGKRVCASRRGAFYTAFFYLVSPLATRQAQNIRMYALLGLLAGLSILFFIRLFLDGERSAFTQALFLVINATGILTHLWFVFVLLAQFAALLVFARRRLWTWIPCTTLAAAPFLVFWIGPFLDQLRNGATVWMSRYPTRFLLKAPLEFYGHPVAAIYYGTAVGLWFSEDARRKPQLPSGRVPLMFLLAAISLGCPLLISLFRPIYYPGRYAIIALPPLAAVLGAVLSARLPRVLLPMLCIPLLAIGVADQFVHRHEVPESELPSSQSDRVTSWFLLQHASPSDAVVFTSLTRPPADYYFFRAHAQDRFVELSFPGDNVNHPGWAQLTVPPGRRHALETEAAATVRRLQQINASGHTIWFYDDGGSEVSGILKRQMDLALPHPRQHPLSGPYHTQLLEYSGLNPTRAAQTSDGVSASLSPRP